MGLSSFKFLNDFFLRSAFWPFNFIQGGVKQGWGGEKQAIF